jgi:hypothetical protein
MDLTGGVSDVHVYMERINRIPAAQIDDDDMFVFTLP